MNGFPCNAGYFWGAVKLLEKINPKHDACFEALMWAVIRQAIEDYIDLKKGRIKPTADCNNKEIRQFFRSGFFSEICPNISGEEVIKLLNSSQGEKIIKRIDHHEHMKYKRKANGDK